MKIAEAVLGSIFPENIYCVCCGSVTEAGRRYSLCTNCEGKFGWVTENTCAVCGKPLSETNRRRGVCYACRETDHVFDKGYTCSLYGLYERALVMDLKYRGKTYIARPMGEMMADRMEAEFGASGGGPVYVPWDTVTWVPVHEKRLEERGYDQAELIARMFLKAAEKAGFLGPAGEVIQTARLLERSRETSAMKDLGPMERRANVRDAFTVRDEERAKTEGSCALIIDDIYTTGATFDACAKALKDGGAAKVYCFSFAAGADRMMSTE